MLKFIAIATNHAGQVTKISQESVSLHSMCYILYRPWRSLLCPTHIHTSLLVDFSDE